MVDVLVPVYQGNDWNLLSDDTMQDITVAAYCKFLKCSPEEVSISEELSERIGALALKDTRTFQDLHDITHDIAMEYDLPYGLALPSINNESHYDVVLAHGTPLSTNSRVRRMSEHAQYLEKRGYTIRNSWSTPGDKTVTVVNTTEGPMALEETHAGRRGRKFIDGVKARMDSQLTTEAEEKALALLKTKITATQYRCYMLNSAFLEKSNRSHLFYIFRKGLPVLVLSYNGRNIEGGKIIACLCLHPYGYFDGTHSGVMPPTDEIISQLLLMRANEKKFWAKSGQWQVEDSRSGI